MPERDKSSGTRSGSPWLWVWIVLFGLGVMALTLADLVQPGNDRPTELSQ